MRLASHIMLLCIIVRPVLAWLSYFKANNLEGSSCLWNRVLFIQNRPTQIMAATKRWLRRQKDTTVDLLFCLVCIFDFP